MKRIAGIAVLVLTAPASADVLCKSKKGAVKARTTCKRSETQLDLSALGSLVVKDANGSLVGVIADALLSDSGASVWVARNIGGRVRVLQVAESGFIENRRPLYYESADCIGTALLMDTGGESFRFIPTVYVAWGLTTGYYPTGARAMHTARSYEDSAYFEGGCPGGTIKPPSSCCFPSGPFTENFTEAAAVDLTALGLVPPFRVEGSAP